MDTIIGYLLVAQDEDIQAASAPMVPKSSWPFRGAVLASGLLYFSSALSKPTSVYLLCAHVLASRSWLNQILT